MDSNRRIRCLWRFGLRLMNDDGFSRASRLEDASVEPFTASSSSRDDTWFPLTIAQRGMWFAQRMAPRKAFFNLAELIEIHGAVDVAAFYAALRHVTIEAAATRLRFVEIDGEPLQSVNPEISGLIPFTDLSHEPDPWAAAINWMSEEYQLPHDPSRDLLWTTGLFKAADDRYFWYHRSHHILIDGFAGGLIARRVAELYSELQEGRTPEIVPYESLSDLVTEDHAYRDSERYKIDRDYWVAAFADKPLPVSLGNYRPTSEGGLLRRSTVLAPDFVDALRTAARAAQGSYPQLMIAAIAIYFYRMTGAEDLVLGMPVTARSNARLRRVPFMLANAVPLRLKITAADTVADVVRQVGKRVREALRHQRYRYEDLRRDLNLLGEGRHLFTSMVNIEPFNYDLRFGHAPTSVHNLSNGSIEDLVFFVFDRGDGRPVHIDIDANPEIYSEDTLLMHVDRLERLLHQIAADVTIPVNRIALLDDATLARIFEIGSPAAPASQLRFMPEDFERQARETPWAVAAGFEQHTVTYRELDEKANQIAHALRAQGAEPERIIGVCLPRGIDMLAALLGVIKSGAAYLPLDPDLPVARLTAMTEDAAPLLILATVDTAAALSSHPVMILDPRVLPTFPTDSPAVVRSPEAPAYVIYTSGSTGKPKGVVLTRVNLANFLGAMAENIPLDPADRMLAVTTVSFDIAALELYLPLLAGARTILVPRALRQHPPALARLIAVSGATVMQATPSLWETLTGMEAAALRSLRILTGGEALPEGLASHLCAIGAEVVNLYGPTETAIWSMIQPVLSSNTPAIGRPIARTQVFVLDSGLAPVPEGIIGDLYIAGAGLARGYLKRSGLTAERFVANPFGPPGSRMYRTGDLAKIEEGVLHFIGRADTQVKLRGFRVELGEIEAALMAEPTVAQAAAILHENRLIGYVVPVSPDIVLDPGLLKRALGQCLPDYMIPAVFIQLREMPLSPAGKLDRKALPAPIIAVASSQFNRTPIQEVLVSLFCDLVGLTDADINVSIFELGADSLIVAKLVATIRDTFGVDLPLAALFETTTLAGLAALISRTEHGRTQIARRPRPARIPLGSSQLMMFEAWRTPGVGAAFNMNLGLRLRGALNVEALEAALNDVLERHESLRTLIDISEAQPAQLILAPEDVRITIAALSLPPNALTHTISHAARLPFEITRELPVRLHLWSLGPDDHALLIVVQHVAADGASLAPLVRDIVQAYAARLDDYTPAWKPLSLQYADYALWQHEEKAGLTRQLEFWRQALAGLPAAIPLPVDYAYPPAISFAGDVAPIGIGAELHAGVTKLARAGGVSLFMVLQAGIAALLCRRGAGDDIPIGSPIANRQDAALDPLIGSFFNHLVLRTDVSANPDFAELIARIRRFNLSAYANQDVPFDTVAAALGARRDGPRQPLFQVMLNFQNLSQIKFDMSGLAVTPEPVWLGTARYELTFLLNETRGEDGKPAGIVGGLEYRADLFTPETAARLVAQLITLLGGAVANPATLVSDLILEV
jgi:nonribosomal peptide synthetase DhbF